MGIKVRFGSEADISLRSYRFEHRSSLIRIGELLGADVIKSYCTETPPRLAFAFGNLRLDPPNAEISNAAYAMACIEADVTISVDGEPVVTRTGFTLFEMLFQLTEWVTRMDNQGTEFVFDSAHDEYGEVLRVSCVEGRCLFTILGDDSSVMTNLTKFEAKELVKELRDRVIDGGKRAFDLNLLTFLNQ